MSSKYMTSDEVAKYLSVGKTRALDLGKKGEIERFRTFHEGTNIPRILFSRESVVAYASRAPKGRAGQRSMLVNLPASEIPELEAFVLGHEGWAIRPKNAPAQASRSNGYNIAADEDADDFEDEDEDFEGEEEAEEVA